MKGPIRRARRPSAPVLKLGRVSMRAKRWEVPDGLWARIESLLPVRRRRFRYPGRKPLDDRRVLQGILFVLHTGIGWEHLPQELGFGCGMTAWRRLREWQGGGCVAAAARAVAGGVACGGGDRLVSGDRGLQSRASEKG